MPKKDVPNGHGDDVGEKILMPEPKNVRIVREKNKDDNREVIPPDGGWGWLVVLGAFFNTTLASLLSFTFTLTYSTFFIENGVSTTMTAWMFNGNQFSWNLCAFFGNSLCLRFGWRKISFIGGLIMAASTAASCFVEDSWHIFITFSLLAGIGQGFCVMTSLSIVPYYFDKKKGLAAGPPIAGISAAQFIGPLLVRHLLENYGFRGTNLILGGILLHSCFFSMFFHPVEWHSKRRDVDKKLLDGKCHVLGDKEKEEPRATTVTELHAKQRDADKRLLDGNCHVLREQEQQESQASTPMLGGTGRRRSSAMSLERISLSLEKSSLVYIESSSFQALSQPPEIKSKNKLKEDNILKLMLVNLQMLKWHRAKIISVTIPLVLAAYMNFLMLVPLAMMNEGFSLNFTSWSLATAGLCNLIFRLVISTLTDFLPLSTKYYFMAGAFGIFITMIMFTVTLNSTIIILIMIAYGTSVGACGAMLSLIPLEFMGLHETSQILALYGLLNAILFIVVGPFVGAIRDATQSFNTAILVLSGVALVAFGLWLLMPSAILSDAKKREKILNENCYLQNT